MEPGHAPPHPWNEAPAQGRPIQLNKKQLRQRIQSRNDFIILFGFERLLTSSVLSPTEKAYYLAVHI